MDLPFAEDLSNFKGYKPSTPTTSSQQVYYHQNNAKHLNRYEDRYTDSTLENLESEGHSILDQYVTVTEADASDYDVVISSEYYDHQDTEDPSLLANTDTGDVLALLLSGNANEGDVVVSQCEEANSISIQASIAKKNGDLESALHNHSIAAKLFREAAIGARDKDMALSMSLLLLSQSQAKCALTLKKFLKTQGDSIVISNALTQKERLRATVRDALVTKKEADISDSVFLGKANKEPDTLLLQKPREEKKPDSSFPSSDLNTAVDDMLELEREFREMDSALDLSNSLLCTRTPNRLKQSTMDGSFMVVPPGSSYMSSSALLSRPSAPRAKANRIQNLMGTPASNTAISAPSYNPKAAASHAGLGGSWWGNASTSSQVLAGSVHSISTSRQQDATNPKLLIRYLDNMKTLNDENAALLREVRGAEAARMEAKAAREQMQKFKAEYGKRFTAFKSALEKFRVHYPRNKDESQNSVITSDYFQSEQSPTNFRPVDDRIRSMEEKIIRQEQMISKLTSDLKKEKDDSKKKDVALRKYEAFYREVKAKSAQRKQENELQQQRRDGSSKE
jgi:hypothetical protein